jgi:hypothetical protein
LKAVTVGNPMGFFAVHVPAAAPWAYRFTWNGLTSPPAQPNR